MAIPDYVLTVEEGASTFVCEWSWTMGSPGVNYLQRSTNDGATWKTIWTVDSPSPPELYVDTLVVKNVIYSYRILDDSNYTSNVVRRVMWDDSYTDYVWVSESSIIANDHYSTAIAAVDTVRVTETAETWSGDYYSFEARDIVRVSETSAVAKNNWEESFSDTVTVTEVPVISALVYPYFKYYLGSNDGKVFIYADDYFSDSGVAINSFWESKDLDFSDQQPGTVGRWKTIERVKLEYVDLGATDVRVSVSTDGGESWDTVSKSLGDGSGTVRTAQFDFHIPGRYFRFMIRNVSGTAVFQWVKLTVFFSVGGEWFEV